MNEVEHGTAAPRREQRLADAHTTLDSAVAAAYGWPRNLYDNEALRELLELNLARGE